MEQMQRIKEDREKREGNNFECSRLAESDCVARGIVV